MNLYGLIGFPLGHSFSKKYFTDKFEREGIFDCKFELFPLENIDLLPALTISLKNLKGLAVTIPYKQSVMPFLTDLETGAAIIGAVNCIGIKDGRLTGFNTDCIGFERSFVPLLRSYHKRALVLGTGGSSKAVTYVLSKLGIPYLSVSRQPSENQISYAGLTQELMTAHNIIINCSPVGMSPSENEMPAISYEQITDKHYCYDLIYAPAKTRFLQTAEQNGAVIKNGYDMLTIQAEENWKIWNI